MDFQKSAVVIAGKELVCVDKFGRPLVGSCGKIPGHSPLQSQLYDRKGGPVAVDTEGAAGIRPPQATANGGANFDVS